VQPRVVTEAGEVRPHVNVFVGSESIRYSGGLATPVPDGAEIVILPAVSGGNLSTLLQQRTGLQQPDWGAATECAAATECRQQRILQRTTVGEMSVYCLAVLAFPRRPSVLDWRAPGVRGYTPRLISSSAV
jgi:hypothetical protein